MKKDKNRTANQVLADMTFFDYLKEKVGERKTKTGAYYDLLEKATAGFVAPFLKNHEYVLRDNQCHVTISDLAVEWHWHRATVRAFLDKLEEMGYIRRTRFAKSMVITVTFVPLTNGESPAFYTGQADVQPADELEQALSEWITGNISDSDMGDVCEHYCDTRMEQIADNSGMSHSANKAAMNKDVRAGVIQDVIERIAVAGLKRAIRNSRFDDPTAFVDFFHEELGDEWSSLLEASKMTAKMILDCENGISGNGSEETDMLATLRQPFKALWAKYQERESSLL
ncbi:MarR family transcriptional regulator [Bacteroides nordii]|uniref:MarR family transcriptional regulator n=1 Tax=Bacteroides nordii TaxID=291645 RepID=UPI00248F695A|nr:MarR family transcriptional regulator [Bacteroides nordii]